MSCCLIKIEKSTFNEFLFGVFRTLIYSLLSLNFDPESILQLKSRCTKLKSIYGVMDRVFGRIG